MIKRIATFIVVTTLAVAVPTIVLAQPAGGGKIQNPIAATDLSDILWNLANWLLGIIGVLALIGIIWSGVRMIAAVGNEQQLASAKRILMWSVAGLIVAILSISIINILFCEIFSIQGCGALGVFDVPVAYAQGSDNISQLPVLSVKEVSSNIVKFLTGLVAILSLTVFIIGAVMMVISLGNEQRVALAKRIMMYSVLGLLLAGGAWVVIQTAAGLIF